MREQVAEIAPPRQRFENMSNPSHGKGNCYDNAAVESFFKSLKAEMDLHLFYSGLVLMLSLTKSSQG